jgi:hypothetical protein
MIHQERIGQTGAVERAINLHGHNRLTITLGYLNYIQRDIHGEDFLIGPFFDRSDAANFPPCVFDEASGAKLD